jgi:hypothetical protein
MEQQMLLHDGDVAPLVKFMTEIRAPWDYTRSKSWDKAMRIIFRRDN